MSFRALVVPALIASLAVACDDDPVASSPDIIVENASAVSISQVFIRDCPVKFWGENRLETNEVIPAGERRSFGVEVGCIDVLILFDDQRTRDRHGIEVPGGAPVVWSVQYPDLAPGRAPATVATPAARR